LQKNDNILLNGENNNPVANVIVTKLEETHNNEILVYGSTHKKNKATQKTSIKIKNRIKYRINEI